MREHKTQNDCDIEIALVSLEQINSEMERERMRKYETRTQQKKR